MAVYTFTSPDRIRAVLGLTGKEITDKQIADVSVETRILLKLSEVYPDHATLWAAIEANTATPDQAQTWRILGVYTDYLGASYLLPQIQMLVVKKITDGDTEMLRFGPDDLAQLRDLIMGTLDEYLGLLLPTRNEWMPTSIFGRVAPAYNPVTFEGGEDL